jgi:hypothetical protein
MRKFLKNIILFLVVALCIGEIVVRLTHVTADIPERTIDDTGIQKYYPNQEGFWKGGKHKWIVNNFGWPGELPKSFDNLITVIGDSFIENFMNPNECHQSTYLKKNLSQYNFMEAGRSGVSLIEAMEISKQMDSLKPICTLIYVTDSDFYESITEVKQITDMTQLSLKNNTIVSGKIKSAGLKKTLYNWKLLYYFYNRFPLTINYDNAKKTIKKDDEDNNILKSKNEVFHLIKYITSNYKIADKILVFYPNSNSLIKEKCKNAGFKIIELDSSNDKGWTFEYDHHWTCYGHKKVAEQVSKNLKRYYK